MLKKKFPIYNQLDQMDCGPACLQMIADYYGRYYTIKTLRDASFLTREGVSMSDIIEAAESIGFKTIAISVTFEELDEEVMLPCILHWNADHFVVLPPQNYSTKKKNKKLLIADPAHGFVHISKKDFIESWVNTNSCKGSVLVLAPTDEFYQRKSEKKDSLGLNFMVKYLTPFKSYFVQLFLGMLIASFLAIIVPFLTQSLVDNGIGQNNISFIYLILMAQLFLFFGNTAIEIIRGWLLLHMSTRVNLSIISDFLSKLMKLPIRFFDSKMVGDIIQRVTDHTRIEQFLTGSSLNTLFSLVNLIVFSIVLGIYNIYVLLIFVAGTMISILWIIYFLKRRKALDQKRFIKMSENQNYLYEIITGMQEIKMNNSETSYRWGWERIQTKLFKISIQSLSLAQYQNVGSNFFTQLKNILITFVSAKQVVEGNMSIGMMLSVSYITGQLNSPISQIFSFIQSGQDAKISIERLGEIHSKENEGSEDEIEPPKEFQSSSLERKIEESSIDNCISLKDVSFRYGGPNSKFALHKINLDIPLGKVTAIVGSSGSGKTTLMKLILKFYDPTLGHISLGELSFSKLSTKWWRENSGVIMSEGFIFSNTVEKNITVGDTLDSDKLRSACRIANIDSFIQDLPKGFQTKIGNTGNGISSGQKQRILIARALYKDPLFIFMDEATSTLDAKNEKEIIENLERFFVGRTVVVIAHRLSTVKHADQIIVLENGEVVEIGKHKDLVKNKGKYYELIRNQLELAN